MDFFRLCCGEGEEEAKFGAVFDQNECNQEEEEQSKAIEQSQKIQNLESQLSYLGAMDQEGRKTIFSCPIELEEDYKPPIFTKTIMQKGFLLDSMRENFLFLSMTDAEKDMFVIAMEPQDFKAGTTIIQQGDVGDFFYIVSDGVVNFIKDGKQVGSCPRGGSFGELALLYDSPRAASCVAETDVSVYRVDQKTFRLMLARHADEHHQDIRGLIRSISIFKNLDETTLNRFTRTMTPVSFKQGDRIVQKGEIGNVFYIIQEGQVRIHDIGLGDSKFVDQILRPGDWFGERALLTGEPRAANATAISEKSVLLAVNRNTFESTIGQLQALMDIEMKKKFLKGLPLFAKSDLTEPEIEQLAYFISEESYSKGDKLAQSGKPYELKLWIIRRGRLLVINPKSGKIYDLRGGDHFGDKSIGGDPGHLSSHNALCEEDLMAWVLTRENIECVVGDVSRLGRPQQNSDKAHVARSVLFRDLKRHRVLGQGAFGKVWLVQHKQTGSAYALKAINKLRIIQAKQERSIVREKELLLLLEHPFILHLVATFQDESHVYLLLPLIPGGELFSVLHRQKERGKGLPNDSAAFYSACIIEGLGHFHQRSIAYRDLKLENVLIDEHGYCVIVDLGFAKIVDDKTYTLVGTPEYLAPEIIVSKGHDKAVDYWSFGVLCFELLAGVSPFFKSGSSQMDMFKRIVRGKFPMPPFFSASAADLISRLLVRKEMERLGNLSRGYLDIKLHPWYEESNANFASIFHKQSTAPWRPIVKDPLDSSNFDDYSELEHEDDYGRRLKKEEQEIFKNF
ncbi:hypothetical protein ACA910_022257 [Epithemia clementina (nom. ined.)]